MILQDDEAIVYLYILNDKSQKLELNIIEFSNDSNENEVWENK